MIQSIVNKYKYLRLNLIYLTIFQFDFCQIPSQISNQTRKISLITKKSSQSISILRQDLIINEVIQITNGLIQSIQSIITFHIRHHKRIQMKKIYTKLFGELDMFGANPTLRSRKEPYSATPCLGAFSLLILAFFLYLFIKNIVEIVNMDKGQINSSKNFQKQFDNQTLENIMFGVSFGGKYFNKKTFNISDVASYQNYFTMQAFVNDSMIQLVPCNQSQWSSLEDNYKNIDISYCPQQPIRVKASTKQSFMQIYFSKCKPDINPNCVSRQLIDQQINKVISEIHYFPIWIYFLSPVVQIKNKIPLNYQVRQKMFSISPHYDKIATGYIIFQKYKVVSDYNIWPIGEKIQQVFGYGPTNDYYSFEEAFRDDDNYTLMHMYIFRNQNVEVYQRSLNKIDGVVSYVGGLFGLIILGFQLFLGRYNEYKYELKVGQSSFNYDNDGFKIRSKDLNFFTYLKYTCYSWFKLLGYKFNWEFYRQLDQTREQAKYCLDISKFFRRLQFLERVIWKQVDPDVLRTQSLIQANSIEETKLKRHFYEYYQKVIQLQQAASVEDVLLGNQKAFQYLKIIFNSAIQRQRLNKGKDTQKPNEIKIENQQSGWIQQSVPQNRQTPQQIKNALMYDLHMEEIQDICEKIANSNESLSISEEAKKLQLKPHYNEVEKKLVESFRNLTTPQKRKVIMKIPLKILHRLRFKAMEMNKSRSQQYKTKPKSNEHDHDHENPTINNEQNKENRFLSNDLFLSLAQTQKKSQ